MKFLVGILTFCFNMFLSQKNNTILFFENEKPVGQDANWDRKEVYQISKNGDEQTITYNKENKVISKTKKILNKKNPIIEQEIFHDNGFITIMNMTTEGVHLKCIDSNKKIFFKDKDCLIHGPDDDSAENIGKWFAENFRGFVTDYPSKSGNIIVRFSISPHHNINIKKIGDLVIDEKNKNSLEGLYRNIYNAIFAIPKTYYPTSFDSIGNKKIERSYSLPIILKVE